MKNTVTRVIVTAAEYVRTIAITLFGFIAAHFQTDKYFFAALFIAFALNIWAGLKADNVSLRTAKNFKKFKFKDSLSELKDLVIIILALKFIVYLLDFENIALTAVRLMIVLCVYRYWVNALRNLCQIAPDNTVYLFAYNFSRFDLPAIIGEKIGFNFNKYNKKNKEDD